ncbi:hypothetical protein PSPO01_07128 [Paraphaeosphaeria sporulosa]
MLLALYRSARHGTHASRRLGPRAGWFELLSMTIFGEHVRAILFGGFAEARWPGVRLRTEVRYLILEILMNRNPHPRKRALHVFF